MPATVPVWLVVGFLGAGKTTLLRRLVKSPGGRKLAFVVNEFSDVDVDAGLVAQEGGVAVSVAGGSIFCHCKVTEFVNVLGRISGGLPGTDGGLLRPEGVVIEASGMADPRSMLRLLAESGLDRRYHVAGVTAVVDPGTLLKLLNVLPNIRGQIEAADLILLNKTDLHEADVMARIRDTVMSINPRAKVLPCVRAEVDEGILLADGSSGNRVFSDAEFGRCKDPHYECETIVFTDRVDLSVLIDRLALTGPLLYRAKGYVSTNAGWKYLDWSAGVLSLDDAAQQETSAVTLIWNPGAGYGNPAESLRQSQGRR